ARPPPDWSRRRRSGWPARTGTPMCPPGRARTGSRGRETAGCGEAGDHGQELRAGERLREVLSRALPLAPDAVALLVATGHEHDRGVSGPLVLLETAQDLVAVALRHHDVEEKDVRELRRQLVFETLTIGVR